VVQKLEEVASATGQPKSIVAGGGAVVLLLLFLFLCPQPLVFTVVGVFYPTYASLKMLADEKTDKAQMWLTYWLLFTSFKVAMGPLDFFLSFIPFYFYLKLTFLLWLFYPQSNGAQHVFDKLIKPHVLPLLKEAKAD